MTLIARDLLALSDAELLALDEAGLAALDAADTAAKARPVVMREAALWYVTQLRWPVFPLQPGGKTPLTMSRFGFVSGFKSATLDVARVRDAWTAAPEANIGTPTGTDGCGFDVLDVDRDEAKGINGYPALADLRHAGCDFDCSSYPDRTCHAWGALSGHHARALTPRGGMHVYVTASGSRNGAGLRQGLDVRGDGGYVALPPSRSAANDQRYAWTAWPSRRL